MRLQYLALTVFVTITLLGQTGCVSTPVPPYAETVDNVDRLRAGGSGPVAVEPFEGDATQTLKTRASRFASPYHGSYPEYLQEALRAELARAGRLDPAAKVSVGGALLHHDIHAGNDTGWLEIEARFMVKRQGQVVYDKVHHYRDEWPSSFVGAIALPMARSRYPIAVNRLLGKLFADPAFIEAIR